MQQPAQIDADAQLRFRVCSVDLLACNFSAPFQIVNPVTRAPTPAPTSQNIENELYEGEICYQFCEDSTCMAINRRSDCASGLQCVLPTFDSDEVGFNSAAEYCAQPETIQNGEIRSVLTSPAVVSPGAEMIVQWNCTGDISEGLNLYMYDQGCKPAPRPRLQRGRRKRGRLAHL